MFRFFTIFSRIEEKLTRLHDMLLLILKEMNGNHPLFFQMKGQPEPQPNQEVETEDEEPKLESKDKAYVDIKWTISCLDTSKSIFYRDIHKRLLAPITFKGRRVYFLKIKVQALADRKKSSGLDYKDLNMEESD